MKNIDEQALLTRINSMLPALNEYQRRRYLATEAKAIGHGGISLVSRLSGMSVPTLHEGVRELNDPDAHVPDLGRSRRIRRIYFDPENDSQNLYAKKT